MRTAILSDIHGNLTAFEAVLADLRETAPDLILHGGDLTDSGAYPTEILDQIRDLNWPGIYGNTDEMLFRSESLQEFAFNLPHLRDMFDKIEEMAAWTRDALGAERLAWLSALPKIQNQAGIAIVQATPDSVWRTVTSESPDLENTYSPLNRSLVVYGHIHRPFIKKLNTFTIANSGSVGQPHDGDHRASYPKSAGSNTISKKNSGLSKHQHYHTPIG